MKIANNERGYALVTVLLIIVIFMVVFLSFMGQAFSSVKQNQNVEEISKSVAAAEMGVSYYQVEIQDIYEKKQSAVTQHLKNVLNFNSSTPNVEVRKEAAKKMAAELQSSFQSGMLSPIAVEGYPEATFKIINFTAVPVTDDIASEKDKIKMNFDVEGKEHEKKTLLHAEMVIDLDAITNLSTGGQGNTYALPTSFQNVTKPAAECKTLDCPKVYINGDGTFSGNNLLDNGQTVYTTGTLKFEGQGNENNKSSVRIHADELITMGKNMNNLSSSIIETNSEAKFMQNLKIDNYTQILSKSHLTVDQHFDIEGNSFVYAGGNSTVGQHLNLKTSSKMCVYGNLNVTSGVINVDSTSKLYVYGNVNNSAVSPYRVTLQEFKTACGVFIPPDFSINWGNNIDATINNIDYN